MRKPPSVAAVGASLPMLKLVEPSVKALQYGKMAFGLVPNGGALGRISAGGGDAALGGGSGGGGGDLGGGERGGGGGGGGLLVTATGGGGDAFFGGGGAFVGGGGVELVTVLEPAQAHTHACIYAPAVGAVLP